LVCKNKETISLLEVGQQVKEMYLEQSKLAPHSFLVEGIDLANSCDFKYKNSRNQRLSVELCLLQLASLTFQDEKKKLSFLERRNLDQFVIPPSYFKKVTPPIDAEENTSEATTVSSQTNTESSVQEPFEQILPKPEKKESEVSKHPERVIERPRILAERNAKRVSALSLRSIQKKKELKKEMVAKQPEDKILPVEDFSEAEMQTAWKDYTNKVEQEGKYNLLSHLTMGVPKLEGTLIHLVFPNNTIKVEVESAKRDLLNHLRSSLKNHNVDISIEVNEAEVKRYAYTTREKFDKLKEKNPLIENLRKEFDLDV